MSRQVFVYDRPERFIAGTVGQPGQRTFYLQASAAGRRTTVALEKTQVALLAERLEQLLDEVLRRSGGTAAVPAVAPVELADNAPLDTPVDEDFRVGAMALAWDDAAERVVVEAIALDPEADQPAEGNDEDPTGREDDGLIADDDVEGPPVLRVRLTGAQTRAFAQ
ncbi:MAG: DUF3090 domain-containing protein, partial [Actinomycetes bacterium]